MIPGSHVLTRFCDFLEIDNARTVSCFSDQLLIWINFVAEIITSTRGPNQNEPTPIPPTIDVVITGHNIEIYQIGSSLKLNCSAVSRISSSVSEIVYYKQ